MNRKEEQNNISGKRADLFRVRANICASFYNSQVTGKYVTNTRDCRDLRNLFHQQRCSFSALQALSYCCVQFSLNITRMLINPMVPVKRDTVPDFRTKFNRRIYKCNNNCTKPQQTKSIEQNGMLQMFTDFFLNVKIKRKL